MAENDAQLLYGLGPFGGLKAYYPGVFTPVRPFTEGPSDAYFSSNVDVHRLHMALASSFGRVPFLQFDGLQDIASINRFDVGATRPYWLAQDSTGRLKFYDQKNAMFVDLGDIGTIYTQAVQCDGNLFLNTGQQVYVTPDATYPGTPHQTLAVAEWQYPKYAATPSLSKVAFTPGLEEQTYYYAFTVVTTVPTINGNVKQESAPIGANAPYPFKETIGAVNKAVQITGIGGGINADGLAYSIRIYRLSTNQPNWFELVTTSDATYVDTATDQSISGNQQLAFSGQPPPLSPSATWPIAEYLDRMWVFAVVQNGTTQNQPQTQLWYSNVGQAWNFDDVAQVLLVGNESTTPAQANVDADLPYGRQPSALVKFGSLLIAFRTTDTWFVTGQDENTFQAIQLFDSVGCIAPASPVVGRGLLAWLSDSGFWTFDGASLNYISDDLWLLLQGIALGDQTAAVGFYWQNYFCWSFPASNLTVRWHAPTQQWDTLPYALTSAAALSSVGANAANNSGSALFNQVVGARPGSIAVDSWFADPVFDLGVPLASDWEGPVSDVGMPHATKSVRYLVVEAPPQDALCTVELHRDLDQKTLQGEKKPFTATFDLSDPMPHVVAVDQGFGECTLLSLKVSFQPKSSATAPVQLWKVEAYGTAHRPFARRA